MDYVSDAARHRNLAAQYRTMAQRSEDEEMRVRYGGIAKAYDALAQREEKLAQLSKITN